MGDLPLLGGLDQAFADPWGIQEHLRARHQQTAAGRQRLQRQEAPGERDATYDRKPVQHSAFFLTLAAKALCLLHERASSVLRKKPDNQALLCKTKTLRNRSGHEIIGCRPACRATRNVCGLEIATLIDINVRQALAPSIENSSFTRHMLVGVVFGHGSLDEFSDPAHWSGLFVLVVAFIGRG